MNGRMGNKFERFKNDSGEDCFIRLDNVGAFHWDKSIFEPNKGQPILIVVGGCYSYHLSEEEGNRFISMMEVS